MTIVTICVGSSCHLRGSERIAEKLDQLIATHDLEGEVIPVGGFCLQKCSRQGATIQVDDDVFTGVTPEGFETFFRENILSRVDREG